jgi:amino acid adenylation domain-containing protein
MGRESRHETVAADRGTSGGTTIPRWTLTPSAGIAGHESELPAALWAVVRRLADELAVSPRTVLLAAHAKALGALAGDTDVTTGYLAAAGRRALPCRLSTGPATWRGLLCHTSDVESALPTHRIQPVDGGEPRPSFETVFDSTGTLDALDEGIVLSVGVADRAGGPVLRLRYRTEALDAPAAARIAGYHQRALALLAADPAAEHARQSLLSAEELRLQLDGLAGPFRELPAARMHQLFERRVAARPDAVAAMHGERRWTYRELNARANRLARALLAEGLRREGVVAVVCERNLDWLAAVLAIFKAGGVYLPIEPRFPADRIARTLSRADCRLVLTERGSTATLDSALATLDGVRPLLFEAAYTAEHPDDDLDVPVGADQLAYIYFTSGSTGEPKGAMCEQAGMLNHLLAKIDALEIGPDEVVAQTAPQCFDISLWQLLCAPLVGGRTVLVEQDVILDVARFVELIVRRRVSVLQVVPSYLEVVLTHLERHPRELPDLRRVSVTGEALRAELTQRWFAAQPAIPLVNAYGLTETSDDVTHEVLRRVPERGRVPLGSPIGNTAVYVVDEHLAPVPLGAPGELVFSGVCVGRGYVNDPERTRLAFGDDPHRPGRRLYRGGDYGRWLPEGKLEFLGRRDAQVKIRGFRIEIGEIENALLRVPGVRDGAVVVADADRGGQLVAFYAGPAPLPIEVLRGRLAGSLPEYMVPTVAHWRERLPLTGNGKIDRNALAALAERLAVGGQRQHAPLTPAERRLAAEWARALGIPTEQVGRRDHFFDRGGTSLAGVKLAINLGRAVSLRDIVAHPILTDLAAVLEARTEPAELLASSPVAN